MLNTVLLSAEYVKLHESSHRCFTRYLCDRSNLATFSIMSAAKTFPAIHPATFSTWLPVLDYDIYVPRLFFNLGNFQKRAFCVNLIRHFFGVVYLGLRFH